MTTSEVFLSTDVYMVCLSHALSTEKEEVMGLLIGEIDEKNVCHVSAIIMLRRSDKRKDRVEISPEQLSAASTQAEELAQVSCRPMRVLGWYHSHPHITVWPSQLDVQTQGAYQMMDEGFIGLIFSVFNEEEQRLGFSFQCSRIQVTCFQSRCDENDPNMFVRSEIPLRVVPSTYISGPCLNALAKLPRLLCQEEQSAYSSTDQVTDMDLLTRLHNSSVYSRTLCQIAEVISGPLLQVLEAQLFSSQQRKQQLEDKRVRLAEYLRQLEQSAEVCFDEQSIVNQTYDNTVEETDQYLHSEEIYADLSMLQSEVEKQTEEDEVEDIQPSTSYASDEFGAGEAIVPDGKSDDDSGNQSSPSSEPLLKKMKKTKPLANYEPITP